MIYSFFTHRQVCRLSELSHAQLNHWISVGAVDPFDRKSGRGARSTFILRNVFEARACKRLSDIGFTGKYIKEFIDDHRDHLVGVALSHGGITIEIKVKLRAVK